MAKVEEKIPSYPAKPYQQSDAGGYFNPFNYEIGTREPLQVHHSGRGETGPFAQAAYGEFDGENFVLIIRFIKGKEFIYDELKAPTIRELQAILDANQGPSLSLSCNPKSDQYNPVFSKYREYSGSPKVDKEAARIALQREKDLKILRRRRGKYRRNK